MIYQLAKISPALTGQVKWDLILNGSTISNMQIVPIHESISFNHTIREDVLNYTHCQNIVRLYKKIKQDFWSPVVRAELNSGYPVRNNGAWIDTHENSYEMGLKRLSYGRYNKQFAFFCPFYCDDIEELSKLSFRIVVENFKGERLSENIIDWKTIQKYTLQYAKDINLDNKLIYLSFSKHTARTTGLNVTTGYPQIIDTSYLMPNLVSQERPMMETDNMILSTLSSNNLIAKQYFNFNFIFNIEDILPPTLEHHVVGEQFNAYVDMYVGDKLVEIRDIYSNYEFIPKYDIVQRNYSQSQNCLDYLEDYRNLFLIPQNKLVQSTFHWTLLDNPKYLFNLYNGCAPAYKGQSIQGMYFDMPDIWTTDYLPEKNTLAWNTIYQVSPNNIYQLNDFIQSILDSTEKTNVHYDPEKYCTVFNWDASEYKWLNSLKIDNIKLRGMTDAYDDLHTCIVFASGVDPQDIINKKDDCFSFFEIVQMGDSQRLILYNKDCKLIIFLYVQLAIEDPQVSNLSFRNIVDNGIKIRDLDVTEEGLDWVKMMMKEIRNILMSVVQPEIITFEETLTPTPTPRPDCIGYDSGKPEIDYYKSAAHTYVIRYDGNIMPYFVVPNGKKLHLNELQNFVYTTKQYNQQINVKDTSDSDMDVFNTYSQTKFTPLYPSLHYFPIKSRRCSIYKYYRDVITYLGEKSWYKVNRFYFLPESFTISVVSGSLTEDKIRSLAYDFLKNKLVFRADPNKGTKFNKFFNNFIWPLYYYRYKFDYLDNRTIDKYKYTITYTLK